MQAKAFLLLFVVYLQCMIAAGQRVWVSPSTTAQQMRNPYTWYRPYYQAAAEAYAKYMENSREISAQLSQQAYITGAWSRPNGGNGGGRFPQNPNGGGNQFPQNPTVAGGVNQNWG